MRVAYIGEGFGTSLHRAKALERVGNNVFIINPRKLLPESGLVWRWLHHTGGLGITPLIERRVVQAVADIAPDVIWINQGLMIGSRLLQRLGAIGAKTVCYINDDPFRRDSEWMRFRLCRQAMPYYDLVAVCRKENVAEARAWGARCVKRVWMSADEIVHRPRELSAEQYDQFACDVGFIGGWMPERGPFIAELIERGVSISIWGGRWQNAHEWPVLKSHWRGSGVYEDQYAAAITACKVCLGLLSKGNRDLHTTRSLEIPALGGLLCAERTSEHLELYREEEEAVFWADARECAAVCREMLEDEPRRKDIAKRGHERALLNGHYNEQVVSSILSELTG